MDGSAASSSSAMAGLSAGAAAVESSSATATELSRIAAAPARTDIAVRAELAEAVVLAEQLQHACSAARLAVNHVESVSRDLLHTLRRLDH